MLETRPLKIVAAFLFLHNCRCPNFKQHEKDIGWVIFCGIVGLCSVAIKLGLKVSQPLVLISTRFFLAALLMLGIALLINKDRIPKRQEWLPLMVCGILNMAVYPTLFVYAMQQVTAGIGTLGSAACPIIIIVLNAIWLRKKINTNVWAGLFMGVAGVGLAIYPLLLNAHATIPGVILLTVSMLCYSIATVYYQSINWSLPRLSINGWQVLFGGLALLPFTIFLYNPAANTFTQTFYFSVLWLVLPISIIAVQLWLYLLKAEPAKASLWLFLCPLFGFLYAYLLTNEPITLYTIAGTVLVIAGLYLGKKERVNIKN